MSKPKQNGQPRSRTAETKRPATPSVIAQAEALRDVLTQALTQTRGLIGALKQRKKQSRLVRTTLASLRQLDEADV